jgi:hypothetical protein
VVNRRDEPIWRVKAKREGLLSQGPEHTSSGTRYRHSHVQSLEAWMHITKALQGSAVPADRDLAKHIVRFIGETPYYRKMVQLRQREVVQTNKLRSDPAPSPDAQKTRLSPDFER